MNVVMVGLDYSKAPIALRERLSFTRGGVLDALGEITAHCHVLGAVLLSTCNRTELYLSCDEETVQPELLLCQAAAVPHQTFQDAFVIRSGDACIHHLIQVACGLKSQILGEDQILAQVKTAEQLAREAKSIDPVLGTLFRTATTCGKQMKSQVRLATVATSAAHSGVLAAEDHFGSLAGKKALVIGNGEMGRLAADLLIARGAQAWVTLRTYRHGETVIPRGCQVVDYEQRFAQMEGMDLVVSATTSPHHTVTLAQLKSVSHIPPLLIDLAIPRDIDPLCSQLVTVLNVDDLGKHTGLDPQTSACIQEIIDSHLEKFYHWQQYRDCMPAVEALKEAILGRVQGLEGQEAALKTVDLLMGGLAESLTPEKLLQCAKGIRNRTR